MDCRARPWRIGSGQWRQPPPWSRNITVRSPSIKYSISRSQAGIRSLSERISPPFSTHWQYASKDWQRTVEAAAALEPEHLSCYGLKVEEGTPLWNIQGVLDLPDGDLQAAAEIHRIHPIRGGQASGRALLQVAAQGGHVAIHLPLRPGQGVKVAVNALALAEGDMDVNAQGLGGLFHW